MIVKRVKEFPGFWEGIGEVMSRHDDLTNLTTGERPSGNHPALHRICHFAGAVNLPVSIHHNLAPVSPSGQPKEPLYLYEIEELFDEHPNTMFIWCHGGISRRVVVEDLPNIISQVLSKPQRRQHVFIDLSWIIFENYIYQESNTSGAIHVDNREEWAKLISKFDGNFMIGSDKVANFEGYKDEIGKFRPLFEKIGELPDGEATVRKLAHDNFFQLMESLREKRGGSGLVLPADYLYPERNYTVGKKGSYIRDARP
jgi:hypothetical protein